MKCAKPSVALLVVLLSYTLSSVFAFQYLSSTKKQEIQGGLTIKPKWNLGDIDYDYDVDIYDLVRCANAYGSTPTDRNWDPYCDIASPYGVINIFDAVTIGASYGKVYTP